MHEANWSIEKIREVLSNPQEDIVLRMKALFYARFHDTPEAIEAMKCALTHDSVLLRHEVAYVMGQMSQPSALPILIDLCDNKEEHDMVRHEAGEALNALGIVTDEVMACVERHVNDPSPPVAETFQLAHIGLNRKRGKTSARKLVDPTQGFYIFTASRREEDSTPTEFKTTKDPAEGDVTRQRVEQIEALGAQLADSEHTSLWDRYVAMFTLRNINTVDAALQLANALDEKSSPLLRHEICFVLGQMQLPQTVYKLMERVRDLREASMARHEAALSLGSVGADIWSPLGKKARLLAIDCLTEFATDPDPIVAESCVVGLHNIEWETGIPNTEVVP